MRVNQRLLVEAAIAAWAKEDVPVLGHCLHEQATARIHMPAGTWPMSGPLVGRQTIVSALDAVVRTFKVIEYRPLKMTGEAGVWTSRVRIHYGHRATGLSYEALARTVCRMQGDLVVSYEVFHDTERLRAFYELVTCVAADA